MSISPINDVAVTTAGVPSDVATRKDHTSGAVKAERLVAGLYKAAGGFVLRRAESRDAGPVKNIVLHTNIQLHSCYFLTPQAVALRHRSLDQYESWLAENDGRVVGIVEWAIEGQLLSIQNLRVDKPIQRRGHGSHILRCLNQLARERGCTQLGLYTVLETGNIGFFEKNGFEECKRAISDMFVAPGGEPVHEVRMLKLVDPVGLVGLAK